MADEPEDDEILSDLDPSREESEDAFEEKLRRKAKQMLDQIADEDEPIEEVEEGKELPDDREPADVVDPDGKRYRVKIRVVATRHLLPDAESSSEESD